MLVGVLAGVAALAALGGREGRSGETVDKPGGQTASTKDGIHRFPNDPYVWVDRKEKTVYMDAQFSPDMTTVYSLLEFLLISGVCNDNKEWTYDRAYESVFVTKADPYSIHMALLLAGFRPGPLPKAVPEGLSKGTIGGRYSGKTSTGAEAKEAHYAPMLDILVEWKEEGKTKRVRVERFLSDRAKDGPPDATPWAYTGSFTETNDKGEKVLASSLTRVVVGAFYDESALINLPFFTLNPHRSGGGLEVNANHLPGYFTREKEIVEGYTKRKIKIPVSHPVTLILKKSEMKAPDPHQRIQPTEKEATPDEGAAEKNAADAKKPAE